MAEAELTSFLNHLARDRAVAASTQNQALSALLFLYREVLQQELGWLAKVERAKKPAKLPVVLTKAEVRRLFQHLSGTPKLMAGGFASQKTSGVARKTWWARRITPGGDK